MNYYSIGGANSNSNSNSALFAVLFSLAIFISASSSCHAHFPANESTYLNFHIPTKLRHNESWPHAASMFGRFGHGPEGSLVMPVKMLSNNTTNGTITTNNDNDNDNNRNLKLCNDNLDQAEVIKELRIPDNGSAGAPFILLVESGGCTFVKKVRNAQHLGAAAVLIADTEHDHLPSEKLPMGDDGSGRDVSIPSMLIARSEYQAIKNATGTVVAEMAWHVPKFENKVVMELWYSPISTHTKEFLTSNFSAIARTFDLNNNNNNDKESYDPNLNLLEFHERPVLLDGKALGCVGNSEAPDEPCWNMCTNGGRYCHVSHRHTDGKYIVMEALRRRCIDKDYVGEDKSSKVYWDYIDHFSNFCWDADNFANEKCVDDAFLHSNIDKKVIESCFEDSGAPKSDRENSYLQYALNMQSKQGIHQSPTVLINHQESMVVTYEGLSPRSVLIGLCDTFAYGEKPHVCYACMHCGDPVACAQRSPMKCLEGDGVEKEDSNAHKSGSNDDADSGKKHNNKHNHKHSRWGRWIFGILLIGGCGGAYVYYKKQMEEGNGGGGSRLGSYSLQDAFLSDST